MPGSDGPDSLALVAETIDDLFQQSLQVDGFKGLRIIIDQMCSLRRYKPWNAFLITAQRPGAVAVASPSDWWKRYGRRILPGARPIVILQPFGPVRFVYEVGDTTGPDLPNLKVDDPFDVKVRPDCIVTNTVMPELFSAFNAADSILIQRDHYGFARAGQAARAHGTEDSETLVGEKDRAAFVVRIARRLAPAEAFATLAHELGHIYCGHLGVPPARPAKNKKRHYWPNRSGKLTTAQCEFEAEATCHVVCQRLGIYPKSAEYLSAYISETDWPHISVANIIRAVHRIESITTEALRESGTGPSPEVFRPPERPEPPPSLERKLEGHELRMPPETSPDRDTPLP